MADFSLAELHKKLYADEIAEISKTLPAGILDILKPGGEVVKNRYTIKDRNSLIPHFVFDLNSQEWEDSYAEKRGHTLVSLIASDRKASEEDMLLLLKHIFHHSITDRPFGR